MTNNQEAKKEWLFGHPRDWAKASSCQHLRVACFAQMPEVEVKSPIDGAPTKRMKVLGGVPSMTFLCQSDAFNNAQADNAQATPEIREQWLRTGTLVNRDICSLCSFFAKRTTSPNP